MTDFILFVSLLGLGFVLWLMRADLKYLRRRIAELEQRLDDKALVTTEEKRASEPAPRNVARAQKSAVVTTSVPRVLPPSTIPPPLSKPAAPPSAGLSFENLVGGKLPIWVGGISLVFAGFFLVRYTIEAGLFGPGARSITATIFALAMIALSELGGRLPKVGASFKADPRLGQSLAGAGVATLYGTLYMAAEIYGLVGIGTAFALIVITTAIAFALSLRHGPPTALMGLVGGFAAPWVAGMGASNLPTLLLYLAVFIAALFGLAVWRRWLWLLVLASSGGLAWSLAMLATANSNLGLLGGFIAITGGGAILAASRFEHATGPWAQLARFAPMTLAFIQLAWLLPKIDFSIIAWAIYLALSGLAIALAWRDRILLPLVAGALLLAIGPLSFAWSDQGANSGNIAITITIASLFALSGHAGARRSANANLPWAIIGLSAPVLCWFAASFSHRADADNVWGGIAVLVALPAMWTAWEWHVRKRSGNVQPWATGLAALMLWMAFVLLIDAEWAASYSAAVALGVAAWAKFTGGKWEERLGAIPLAAAIMLTSALSYPFFDALAASLSGEGAFYNRLPTLANAARTTLIPSLLIAAIGWRPVFATGRRMHAIALFVGGTGVIGFSWLLAKQVAEIVSPSDFIRLGFAERAVFTQALFAAGWFALTKSRALPQFRSLRSAGLLLTALALCRIVWFDLLIHNPAFDPQAVGPVPVANLITSHFALSAFWLWLLAREVTSKSTLLVRTLSLGMMIVTILASVRQAVQGNLLSGAGIDTGENYLYSVGLLGLAIGWLAIGISRGSKLLRIAGLVLLTGTTLKVFLIDAAALTGLLRILSFLGLGIALIGIGWAYGRLMGVGKSAPDSLEQATV